MELIDLINLQNALQGLKNRVKSKQQNEDKIQECLEKIAELGEDIVDECDIERIDALMEALELTNTQAEKMLQTRKRIDELTAKIRNTE